MQSCQDKNLFPEDYKYALKKFILTCHTPTTISLQGEWGSGKTTLMEELINMQIENVDDDVYFLKPFINAWELSQFNMDSQLPFLIMSKIINLIDNNVKIPSIFKKGLKIAGNLLGGITTKNNHIIDDLMVKDYFEQLDSIKDKFEKAVDNRLDNEHKSKNGRLVIFIDDLDRIPPQRALEVLECLKNFLQTPRCIFVLAIDYDVVVKGAEEKYGLNKGKAFFDKIIQLPFSMPVAFYNVPSYLRIKLNEIQDQIDEKYKFVVENNDEELDTVKLYNKILKLTVGTNPRTINRIFNLFDLMINADIKNYEIGYKKNLEKKINIGDYDTLFYDYYFIQICIQDKYPALWNYILKSLADSFKIMEELKKKNHSIALYNKEIEGLIQNIYDGNEYKNYSNEKELLKLYCNILKRINNSKKLGNRTIFETVAIFRNIDGYLNI